MPPVTLQLDAAEWALYFATMGGQPKETVTGTDLVTFLHRAAEGPGILQPTRAKVAAFIRAQEGLLGGTPLGNIAALPATAAEALAGISVRVPVGFKPAFEINVAWFEALSDKHSWVHVIGTQKYVLIPSENGKFAVLLTRLDTSSKLLVTELPAHQATEFAAAALEIKKGSAESQYTVSPHKILCKKQKSGFYEFYLYTRSGHDTIVAFRPFPLPGNVSRYHHPVLDQTITVSNWGPSILIRHSAGKKIFDNNLFVFKTLEELFPKPDPKTVPLTVEWLRNLPKDYPGFYPIGNIPLLILYNSDHTKFAILLPSPDGRHIFTVEMDLTAINQKRLAEIQEFSQVFAGGLCSTRVTRYLTMVLMWVGYFRIV